MSDILITAISSVITAFGGAFAGWFFTRKKHKAETKKTESEAKISELSVIEDAIKIWRETAEALTAEVKALRNGNAELRNEVNALRCENENLHIEIGRLRSANNRIVDALKKITSENAKQVVEELKKNIDSDINPNPKQNK